MPNPHVVLMIDSDGLVGRSRPHLEVAGFSVVSSTIAHTDVPSESIPSLLGRYDPKVVLIDVVSPFEATWLCVQHLRADPAFDARTLVMTTPDTARALQLEQLRDAKIYESVPKGDVDEVIRAVREASKVRDLTALDPPPLPTYV